MPLWSLFLAQAALPPKPPAVTVPAPCPTPPKYTYSDWELNREERQFQDGWVVQYLHYSRMKSDECRGTELRQTKVEGPFRLFPAVPANRVADVNRPTGSTESVSGSPLRSSDLPNSGAPGAVGPTAQTPSNDTQRVPENRAPLSSPFFPGFVLFAGALAATVVFRRRKSLVEPVAPHVEEPVQAAPVSPSEARTLDSIEKGEEWVPTPAEVEWLQAFFGISSETGYGALTQEAVRRFQEQHGIPVDEQRMIGLNTYRALWEEHLDLIHERWQRRAEGRRETDLDRLLDSPMPSDLRQEMLKLNEAYAAYWAAVEGRYKAIDAGKPALVERYEQEIVTLRSGLQVDSIPVLMEEYQPSLAAMFQPAQGEAPTHPGTIAAVRLGDDQVSTRTPQDAVTTQARPSVVAPTSPSSATAIGNDDMGVHLAKYFPNAQDQLIIKHTMSEEGPGKYGANWGGVVYVNKETGQLTCDRQWINFGLISFAYPLGSGGGILKRLLSDPQEEKAFREIALAVLDDQPGGVVPEGWRHLLNAPTEFAVPAMTKEQLAGEFVARIKAGNAAADQDWMFKYLNTPVTQSGVASGKMREDWNQLLSHFLSRPASKLAQLDTARAQYFDAAVEVATDRIQGLGLTTVRGVGFAFDVMVQSGSITKGLLEIAKRPQYRQASEIEKLKMLRDWFGSGSTEWHRRDSVIRSKVLTDELYLS